MERTTIVPGGCYIKNRVRDPIKLPFAQITFYLFSRMQEYKKKTGRQCRTQFRSTEKGTWQARGAGARGHNSEQETRVPRT